ncbi:MAG: hypothetical protein ABGX21_04330 [Candidatus Poseidoniia archaeon]
MEERPEAIEISPRGDESPWGGDSGNSGPGSTILSGNVTSFEGEGENSPYWANLNEERKGPSNGGWFAIGLILAPGAMWFVSFILFIIGDSMPDGPDEIFYMLAWFLWPAGLIGGLVWSFTRGSKYFAYGLLTALAVIPAVFILSMIVMVIVFIGF